VAAEKGVLQKENERQEEIQTETRKERHNQHKEIMNEEIKYSAGW
jgi:hypothetical protein